MNKFLTRSRSWRHYNQQRTDDRMDRDGRPGWVPSLGFAFLTFNCGLAVYRSWDGDDPSAVAFVVVAYVSLVLLFRCLHLLELELELELERRRRDQYQQRLKLKHGVWGLSTLLTLMFSYKVAAIVPPLWAKLLVWAMGTFTVLVGFYAFFLARPRLLRPGR